MSMDMGLMAVVMIVVALVVVIAIGVVVYGAIRAARNSGGSELEDARATLDHRLASGDITPEEYYERESALRSGEGLPRRRRGR